VITEVKFIFVGAFRQFVTLFAV